MAKNGKTSRSVPNFCTEHKELVVQSTYDIKGFAEYCQLIRGRWMVAGMTLPQIFFEQAERRLEQKAFYYCRGRDHKWVSMSWKRYREEVSLVAQWLEQQGLRKGQRIAIIAANRPEWIIVDLAILSLGAVSIPIYATSTEADVNYVLEHSESELLFVDQLDRVPYLSKHPIKTIVSFDKASKKAAEGFNARIFSLSNIIHEGSGETFKLPHFDLNDEATIIYTSGTTGRPKGVVHSHGNLTAAADAIKVLLEAPAGKTDRFFSFLPLSHVAERILVEVGSIITGAEVAFARSVETLAEDLQRCRPTILLCVPRLWEKIFEKINSTLLTAPTLRRGIFSLAKTLGQQRKKGDLILRKSSWGSIVSDALVGKKLRERLGLDETRILLTGSAPTRPEVMEFFGSFGLLIREVYGLTENLCLGVLNDADEIVIGSCGKPFVGNEMRLASDGEIEFRAPWMFKGYLKNEEATREVLAADGWFSTGDLGSIDEAGRLRIVGRKKELLKTSGGKYVAPVPIEDSLKALSLIKEAIVIGDNKKYCVALIALDEELLRASGSDQYKEQLKNHLKKVNEKLASFESIKRVGIIKEGFTISNGALTPSLKVRRNTTC